MLISRFKVFLRLISANYKDDTIDIVTDENMDISFFLNSHTFWFEMTKADKRNKEKFQRKIKTNIKEGFI